MSSIRTRCAILGSVLACLAAVMLTAFVGMNRIEHVPASPTTLWSADDDDAFNLMEEQQAEETAQQAQDLAQQEQQIVDQQNAFDESMTAGNN